MMSKIIGDWRFALVALVVVIFATVFLLASVDSDVVSETEINIWNSLDGIIPIIQACLITFGFIMIVMAKPKIDCYMGMHKYRTIKAVNLKDGKLWEITERCQRCGDENTRVGSRVGRF